MRNTPNSWNLALCLSLAIHLAVFVTLPRIITRGSVVKTDNKPKEIEIITETIKKSNPSLMPKEHIKPILKETAPPYINRIVNKVFTLRNENVNIDKPRILDNNLKNIIFAKLPKEEELKKNPAYMDYYQLIRERIRSKAYRYYDSDKKGEVFLNFIISKDGKLEGLYLNNTSSEDKDLIEIALRSIKDASPFPPFPPELKYPRLQFNISIYFKNN